MTPSIYLDLDNTLVDWCSPILRRLGFSDDFRWPENIYEMEKALGIPDADIRKAMADLEFWTELELTDFARELVAMAESLVGIDNVYILTKPDKKTPMSGAGKMIWIDRYMPDYGNRLIMTAAKYQLSGPGQVLVDDDVRHLPHWTKRGGVQVLVPRRWNPRHAEEAHVCVQELKGVFDKGFPPKRDSNIVDPATNHHRDAAGPFGFVPRGH